MMVLVTVVILFDRSAVTLSEGHPIEVRGRPKDSGGDALCSR